MRPETLCNALTIPLLMVGLFCLGASPLAAATLPANSDKLRPGDSPIPSNSFGTNDSSVVRSMTVAQLEALAAQKLNRDLVTRLLGPLPEWVQRIEVSGNFDLAGWRGMELLTVQPLWETATKDGVFFTQASAINYRMFDRQRFAGNLGLGYRQLLLGEKLLLGGNLFYDHEFLRGHHRLGLGAEVKYGPLDLTANGYLGLNQRSLGDGSVERVPNGVDVELGSQLPYLPWARVYGKYYAWDNKLDSRVVRGAQMSGEASLHRYLSIEGGARRDAGGKGEGFFMVRFKLNRDTRPGLFEGAPLIDDKIFAPRDLHRQLLTKVRRENRIILERSNPLNGKGGLTVTVSRRN